MSLSWDPNFERQQEKSLLQSCQFLPWCLSPYRQIFSDELSFCCRAVNFLGDIWQPYRAYYINKCIQRVLCSYSSICLMGKQKHSPLPLLESVVLVPRSACRLENAETVRKGFSESPTAPHGTRFPKQPTVDFCIELQCMFGAFLLTLFFWSLLYRKKVLDFYQRACLSGYCSAFAYKPMHCALSSQLNGKCIELVQVPGQSAIFTCCDLPGTTPIKQSSRRNSWSSDGTCFLHGLYSDLLLGQVLAF